jgi:hypothetical protein
MSKVGTQFDSMDKMDGQEHTPIKHDRIRLIRHE